MKKKIALLLISTLALSANVFASEAGYITKAEIEAAGKNPWSVDYKYQQDYIDGKPIPESAVYYEKMVTKSSLEAEGKAPDSVDENYRENYFANMPIPESAIHYKTQTVQPAQTYILNWNGEYGDNSKKIKVVQNGTDFTVTVIARERTKTTLNPMSAFLNQLQIGSTYDPDSYEYKQATQENVINNLYGKVKTTTTPEKVLFTTKGTLNGDTVWLYPGQNYKLKLEFKVLSQSDRGDHWEISKQVTLSDNASDFGGKNPFDPEISISGQCTAYTVKNK